MRQILIVIVFLACAAIESPEDYVWMDNEYSTEIAADFNMNQGSELYDEDDFSYNAESDIVADENLPDQDTMVYRF